jgi:hypothetical protein
MIAEIREFFIEGGDCGLALFQQVVDKRLFVIVERFLLREELLDVVGFLSSATLVPSLVHLPRPGLQPEGLVQHEGQ